MNNLSIRWLSRRIGRGKLLILLLLLIQAFLGISTVIFSMLLKNVIDNAAKSDRNGFIGYFIGCIGLVVLQLSFNAANRRLLEHSHSSFENTFKERLFSQLLMRDYGQVTGIHSAEWLNRLTSDTVVCANGATDILPSAAGMGVKLIGAVVMLLVIEPRFAFILIPGGAALTAITYGFKKVLKRLHKNIQEKDGALRITLQERLESLSIVRSFAVEEESIEEARQKMLAHKDARMKRNTYVCLSNLGFVGAMDAMYLIGLAYGGLGLVNGSVSYGTLTAILSLINQIRMPFHSISGILPQFYAMCASAERLMEAEEYEGDETVPLTVEEIHELYETKLISFGLTQADFSYKSADRNPTVLKGLSVDIKKGEFAAITGHSGCGKSTMIKLFMCLYKLDGGERYIDAGEHREITRELQRLFAYVPQGNHLMSGTIRDVVTMADRKGREDDDRIDRALKIACAKEFVDGLDNGVETLLGEKGQGLSEGQMQRLAVARAVFSDNPVLLLDEATSALDEATESRLLENIRSMTDKTVLIVTHRPRALELCDKIIHMTENGTEVSTDK